MGRDKTAYLRSYRDRGVEGLPAAPEPEPAVVEGPVQNGVVKFYEPRRGYGFIASGGSDFFFHIADVEESVILDRGDQVTFVIGEDSFNGVVKQLAKRVTLTQKAPERAVPIRKDDEAMPVSIGRVASFDLVKRFGFIDRGLEHGCDRVFFHEHAILWDALGHHCDVVPGIEVEYIFNPDGPKGSYASNVRPLNRPVVATIDLANHREFSRVSFWDGTHGYLDRSCGNTACRLPLFIKDITTTGADEIKLGDFVQHGVMPRGRTGSGQVRASSIVLFEPGFQPPPVYEVNSAEAYFASLPDVQPDSQPEPAPAEPQIYTATERKMSLRALISKNKAA